MFIKSVKTTSQSDLTSNTSHSDPHQTLVIQTLHPSIPGGSLRVPGNREDTVLPTSHGFLCRSKTSMTHTHYLQNTPRRFFKAGIYTTYREKVSILCKTHMLFTPESTGGHCCPPIVIEKKKHAFKAFKKLCFRKTRREQGEGKLKHKHISRFLRNVYVWSIPSE